jgi:hypothetical protein
MWAEEKSPRRTALGPAAVVIGSVLACAAACHRAGDAPVGLEAAVAAPGDSEGPPQASAVLAARCRALDSPVAIDEANATELELGDMVSTSDGYALGAVHRTAVGRVAAVMSIPRALDRASRPEGSSDKPTWLDLAPTLGDAPPPRLVSRVGGSALVVAAYLRGGLDRGTARNLALYKLASAAPSGAPPPPFLVVQQQHDDSLAFDLAFAGPSGVVVWDEGAAPSRGVIRALSLEGDAGAAGAHDVSPPESDAELPRVVADGSGFVAIWIARKAEPGHAADGAEPEAPGEPRSFGWLESVRLDARGAPTGAVRSLTPASGHVSAYDVAALATPARALLVVARDDGESVDGSGGALVRVRIVADVPEPPVEFQSDGLGRGAPALVEGPSSFLAWVGPGEQGRLLALDRSGAPLGPPSAEETLNDARPLRVLDALDASASPGAARMLVAASSGATTTLRVLACQR